MIKLIFGTNLKKYRNTKQFTREYLAEMLDISATQIYKIESGKSFASAELIEKISKLFGIPVFKLFITDDDISIDSDSFLESAHLIKKRIDQLFSDEFYK